MVESSLTQGTFKKLRAFTVAANKQAPSHPFDQERWREFVIGAHREGAQLAAEEVRDWLIGQGFPEDKREAWLWPTRAVDTSLSTTNKYDNRFHATIWLENRG